MTASCKSWRGQISLDPQDLRSWRERVCGSHRVVAPMHLGRCLGLDPRLEPSPCLYPTLDSDLDHGLHCHPRLDPDLLRKISNFYKATSHAGTTKVKSVWILLKQETVSCSGISWAICKSALCSRQITMPAPHHSVFYRPDALPATQPTASNHRRQKGAEIWKS